MKPVGKAAKTEVSIVFSAAAGLGLRTAEDLCRTVLSRAGFYVFTAREYMSRVRGGNNSTQIRVSTSPVRAATERTDWLIALSPKLRDNVTEKIAADTKIVGDAEVIGAEISALGHELVDLGLAKRAAELGGAYYSSMIVAGFIAGVFALPADAADGEITDAFAKKPEALEKNKTAFRIGHGLGTKQAGGAAVLSPHDSTKKDEIFLDGDSAVSLGAAAAGCNYIATYPMSPGTGVFTYFSKHAHELGAVVEQAEDEIAVVNMIVGASYAGARAMATTSGGGFALMTEGISLAGITETPIVIHLAQRPGPATGLATRTEQGDIDLALYAGHGEFPRALYAPINIESAFRVAGKAFQAARKFQTPAFILTDQYLLDNAYDVERPDPHAIEPTTPPVKTDTDYKRYDLNAPDGVSPFAVPGFGEGFVSFDSHEHTEDAHITEDRGLRRKMVEKRLAKGRAMQREALPPIVVAPKEGKPRTLVVCWGSTFEPLKEALEILGRTDVALVACEQLYPLSSEFVDLLASDTKKVFVEGNATSQFARLVRSETGLFPDREIHKYDGFQFSVEELVEKLRPVLDESAGQEKEAE